jgi:hypothetical protein
MSGAKVLNTINFMCRFYGLGELMRMILALLDDRVITQTSPPLRAADTPEVYGSEAQIALMRRIRNAVLAEWQGVTVRAEIDALDGDVVGTGQSQGPMFFDIVIILWDNWIREMRELWESESESESSESGDGSSDAEMGGGSEDEAMDSHEMVRRTGRRRLPGGFGGRDMGTLLTHLKSLYT